MHFRRNRNDRGFSMMEMLGAIAIAGIIAGAAIITIPRFLNRATNSQAVSAINTAVAEVQELYSRPLPGGETNFANTVVGTLDSGALTNAAVNKLNDSDSNLTFRSMAGVGTTGATSMPSLAGGMMTNSTGVLTATYYAATMTPALAKAGADKIQEMNDNDIWVAVAGAEDWGTIDVRAGQAIRLGTASSNGATFCAIIVADTSTGAGIGRGFMAVTEASSEAAGWADCGLLAAVADRDDWAPGELYTSLQEPSARSAATP